MLDAQLMLRHSPSGCSTGKLLRGDGGKLCRLILPDAAAAVAVVGNGPLNDTSRPKIAESDVIIRFNELNNRSVIHQLVSRN